MEAEFEEEIYHKLLLVIILIIVVIVFIFILDVMTGGTLFREIICMIVWYIPVTGRQLAAYLRCHVIPM